MLKRPTHYRTSTRDQLTERQLEVLAMIADGKTNPEIAYSLGITLDGAKFHVREILGKLGVESREEAAAIYRQERRPVTRAGAFLRGVLSFGWLKGAGALAAVGGIALGSMAVTIALTQGGDGDTREPAIQDAGGAGIGALATPTRDDRDSAGAPPACDEASVEWQGETRRNEDGSVRLDIYARSVGATAPCELDLDITLTPVLSASPGTVQVFAPPVSERVTEEIGRDWSPLFVTSSTNVCDTTFRASIYLEWRAPSGASLGSNFEIDTPSCTDRSARPMFTVMWWRLLSSTLPRMTPVPTPTVLRSGPPRVIYCDSGLGGCPDKDAFIQAPDFSFFEREPLAMTIGCGPSEPPCVYVLDSDTRSKVTVAEYLVLLDEARRDATAVVAIGDSAKGAIDLLFRMADGQLVSVALSKVDGEWRPSGLKRWATMPANASQGDAAFGSADYYHVDIPLP